MTNIQIGDTVMVVDMGERVEFLSIMLGEDIYEHGAELGETGVIVAKFGTTDEDGFEVDFGRVFEGNGKTTQAMKLSWIEKVEGDNNMIKVGTKVKVVHEDHTHHAKVGDIGVVTEISFGDMFIVKFEGKTFVNGLDTQMLELHDVQILE